MAVTTPSRIDINDNKIKFKFMGIKRQRNVSVKALGSLYLGLIAKKIMGNKQNPWEYVQFLVSGHYL
ncbi:MAG: Transposase [Candidatus Midichloria mitochondrii]|uniref:Uncharacterized protein n=1 Tax=Midichloria mitochondrii (strain IricVA) TaxID=696127 RepID=F7XWT1_MIDMI|nr:hypothetical protein midi_00842 [Candidatus Midichloria mitochondrii IricVA]